MQFRFISRYRDESDYLPARSNSGDRWRIRDNGRLTIGFQPATVEQIAAFNAWRIADHNRQIETMRADPVRYPPEFYDATALPRGLATH